MNLNKSDISHFEAIRDANVNSTDPLTREFCDDIQAARKSVGDFFAFPDFTNPYHGKLAKFLQGLGPKPELPAEALTGPYPVPQDLPALA